MNAKRLLLVGLVTLVALGFSVTPLVYANSAWGNWLDHNFTADTVHGLRSQAVPYWLNPVAWSGPDNHAAFVLTLFSEYNIGAHPSSPGYQIAVLTRAGSILMDTVYQLPGQTSFTTWCTLCKDGTISHVFAIARITDGWQLRIDGAGVVSQTCTCMANDKVDQTHNQIQFALEVAPSTSNSYFIDSFRVGKSFSLDYQDSAGVWKVVPHARAYYSGGPQNGKSNTDTCVGCDLVPTFASVNTDGPQTTKAGTSTYLTPKPVDAQLW